jgi:shikimate dehydrogenase
MPLKEEALGVSKRISDDAKLLSSINTLVRNGSVWEGFNTDVFGFQYLLREFGGNQVTILGAGGTARAALLAAKRHGMTSSVIRRNPVRDEALKKIDGSVKIPTGENSPMIKGTTY